MRSDILWAPGPAAFQSSGLARFATCCGFDPADYETLHRWSISDKGAFWRVVWDFGGVVGSPGDKAFIADERAAMTGARFFPEATLNFAENMLSRPGGDTAVHAADEAGAVVQYSRDELRAMVARTADGLRAAGTRRGDRVGGILPNGVEALVALLATAAIGATWSSCSPDFGATAILDRLGQIRPRILFAAARYRYAGKDHDIGGRIAEVARSMEGLATIVLCSDGAVPAMPGHLDAVRFEDFGSDAALAFEPMPFSHPLYVLYTSGTTGAPKAIVHSAGGVLLQHLKEHLLHGDVRPGDVMSWYTNTAWMMYHWLVSGLACGASVVLSDGAPLPKTTSGLDLGVLWRVAELVGTTHFGTSPRYLQTLADHGYHPGERHDLPALRWLLSAGAPVAPAQFDWVYDRIKRDLVFASISGGTEIIGCFMLGSPLHPVRRGQLTAKGLGMAVAVMDERNAPAIGRQGDLVCTEAFPSMPLTFWGEGGDGRYRDTYFAERPEIWTHGDIAEMTVDGGAVIYGRADTTLKPGGVRIGTAEIYAACERIGDIEDCLVFGAPANGDEEIVLCVRLKEEQSLTAELAARIRRTIRDEASPRHVPHRIHAVADIPYTLNGKRVEGAARTVVAGGMVKYIGSLANPDCLGEYGSLDRSKAA